MYRLVWVWRPRTRSLRITPAPDQPEPSGLTPLLSGICTAFSAQGDTAYISFILPLVDSGRFAGWLKNTYPKIHTLSQPGSHSAAGSLTAFVWNERLAVVTIIDPAQPITPLLTDDLRDNPLGGVVDLRALRMAYPLGVSSGDLSKWLAIPLKLTHFNKLSATIGYTDATSLVRLELTYPDPGTNSLEMLIKDLGN